MSIDNNGGVVLRGGPAVVVTPPSNTRIPGLDAARGLAILGMLAAHTLPGDGDSFYDGRSSILFATLAGISLGLMTSGASRAHARLSIAMRALLLIVLGLALWLLATNIAIILDSYGFLFLLCLPLLFVNRWALAGLAVVCALFGPAVVDALVAATSSGGAMPVAADSPLTIPLGWLDAYYPAPVWLAYILAGLAVARFGITRPRVQLVLVVGGSVAAAVGYAVTGAFGEPVVAHSDTTTEAISSGSLAIAVIALLVMGVGRITTTSGSTLLRPLLAAGSMPLSIYTAQVLAIAVVGALHPGAQNDAFSWALFLGLAVGSLAFAVLWRRRFAQGPLEWVFARLTLRRPWRTPGGAAGSGQLTPSATPTR